MSNVNLNFDSIILQCEREVKLFGTDILLEIDEVYEIYGYSFSVVDITKKAGNLLIRIADINSDIQLITTKFKMEFEISRSFACSPSPNDVIGYNIVQPSDEFFIPTSGNFSGFSFDGASHYITTTDHGDDNTMISGYSSIVTSGEPFTGTTTGDIVYTVSGHTRSNYSAIDFVNSYRCDFGAMTNEE